MKERKITLDAVLSRILREMEIELGIDQDLIKEIVLNQGNVIGDRIEKKEKTTLSNLGTFRIKPYKEMYAQSMEELKVMHPDLSARDLKKMNRELHKRRVAILKAEKEPFIRTTISIERVTLIKKNG